MNSLRQLTLMLCLLITGSLQSFSQLHLFAGGGAMNYQGDLQSWKQGITNFHLYATVGGYYEITEKLFMKLGVTLGKVSGSDEINKLNANRNLSFESNLLEIQLGAEYDILNSYEHRLVPYVMTGFAAYRFNPYAFDTRGNRIFLQPLGTEGQGFIPGRTPYALTQLALPIGGGVKFALTDNISIRLDGSLRKLFTDYLDDVSSTYADGVQLLANNGQLAVDFAFRTDEIFPNTPYPAQGTTRGNPRSKDFYYTAGITLSYRIQSGIGRGKAGSKKTGCPVNLY